ncbi:MAG: NUDIX hydrolase [Clostridium sp.]|nr:NUDIX hydrolase [Clostridium sp.]MDU7084487.1 NUDIX hydrolase [Clostridium sp.]
MELFEKTISEEYKYKGKVINLKVQQVELPNGRESSREIVEHPGAVAIIPFLNENTIIMTEQFRKALDQVLLEIPAGKIDKGEETEKCGIRELEEETGYKAENFEYLGKIVTAPGFTDEVIYIYKASNLYKGKTNMDEDEFINLRTFTLNEVKAMVKSGEIIDSKTIAALAYL